MFFFQGKGWGMVEEDAGKEIGLLRGGHATALKSGLVEGLDFPSTLR